MKKPRLRLVLVVVVVFLSASVALGQGDPGRRPATSNTAFGIEGIAKDDHQYAGTSFVDVRNAVFANPYSAPYERVPVTLGSLLRGVLPFGKPWQFLAAARRTVASDADLRWGPDGKGYRRLLHPSGVCLTGMW